MGVPELRQAVARHSQQYSGLEVDWQTETLVTVGATEALAAAFLGLLNEGDEVCCCCAAMAGPWNWSGCTEAGSELGAVAGADAATDPSAYPHHHLKPVHIPPTSTSWSSCFLT